MSVTQSQASLPVTNIINITVTETPSGLQVKNVNALVIFTQDQPINNETYGIYLAPSQVEANYGTASKTLAMADNVFAQLPNPLSGNGYLVIIPMLAAVSATHGKEETPNINANLAAIIAVTNGSIGVTLNGGASQQLSNLNFTGLVTWAQIAAYLNNLLVDGKVYATAGNNGLGFTSHKVGTGSTVALVAGGTGTNLYGAGFFNGAAATATIGANATGETIPAAIARTQQKVAYVGVMSSLDLEDAAIETNASFIQAQDMMYFQHVASTGDVAGIGTTVQQAAQTKTRILLYTEGQDLANLYKAAYAGRLMSVDFTGSNTSSTQNLKQLANVTPDPGITQTLYNAAGIAGVDLYVSYDGVPCIFSTGGNLFADEPYSELAFKFALQTAGFNYLRQTNTKTPQTEPGMTGLKDAYAKVCRAFVTNGFLAPGQWNSGETFGDPVIFNNNILQNGFYIFSQPIAQQNSVDRTNRIAPLVQIAGKEAGAIHKGNVLVNINP